MLTVCVRGVRLVIVSMGVGVWMGVCCAVGVRVLMGIFMLMRVVNIELRSSDSALFTAADVDVVSFERKFSQLLLDPVQINAEVDHGADEHVAADAAEDIKVERLH